MSIAPFVVSLREGIEAVLVIVIMLTYLRRTNQRSYFRVVGAGTLAAVAVSIGMALTIVSIWGVIEGPSLALFEGSIVILAAILLTTMIIWMRSKGSEISGEIEETTSAMTSNNSKIGLSLLAFALVAREGVELVLFTAAMFFQDGLSVLVGVAGGLLLAAFLGMSVYFGALQLNMKSFFKWTSALLVLFAAGMLAYGIHEIQEAGFLLFGPLEVWNINPALLPDGTYPLLHEKGLIGGFAKALLGYNGNPSALEVISYIGYLIMSYLLYQRPGRRGSARKSDTVSVSKLSTKEIEEALRKEIEPLTSASANIEKKK
jgi:high-affinity iron transporter